MHPALALMMAAASQPQPRPPTPQERALAEQVAYWDGQAILFERMSATLNRDHGTGVRDELSSAEIEAFTTRWSAQALDTVLAAGLTRGEVRRALVTGDLPDPTMVSALARLREAPR